MVKVQRIVLDVLKPHQPNGLEFATLLGEKTPNCRIKFVASEVDEKTETVVLTIEGQNINFDDITETIQSLGGSVHSIDEVEVLSDDTTA